MVENYDWLLNYSQKLRSSKGHHKLSFVANYILKLECKISIYPSQCCLHIKINSLYVIFSHSWFSFYHMTIRSAVCIPMFEFVHIWVFHVGKSINTSVLVQVLQTIVTKQPSTASGITALAEMADWPFMFGEAEICDQTHPNVGISSNSQCLTSQDTLEFL